MGPLEIVLLAEMRDIYNEMVKQKVDSINDTDDDFIISHLEGFGCSTLADLKKKHNELAINLGNIDLLIE